MLFEPTCTTSSCFSLFAPAAGVLLPPFLCFVCLHPPGQHAPHWALQHAFAAWLWLQLEQSMVLQIASRQMEWWFSSDKINDEQFCFFGF